MATLVKYRVSISIIIVLVVMLEFLLPEKYYKNTAKILFFLLFWVYADTSNG